MAVDEEITIRSVLVLANACFEKGSVLHSGEAVVEVCANQAERLACNGALITVRIEGGPTTIKCNLESAVLQIGESVEPFVEIDPRGHPWHGEVRVSCGRAKKIDLLPRREHRSLSSSGKTFGSQGPQANTN